MRNPPLQTVPAIPKPAFAGTRFVRLATLFLASIATMALATNTHAQASDGLKAGAYDAQRAADEAATAAEAARQQAAGAAERLQAAEAAAARASEEAAAQAAAVNQAEAATPTPAPASDTALEEARAEAASANRKAEEALAAVDELMARFAYDRSGFYLGGGVFWAPEVFNSSPRLSVADSRGLSGWLGYRFSPHFATEIRVDRIDDFKLKATDFRGQVYGWSTTVNVKVFVMTGRLQPFVDLGVGAFMSDFDHTHPESDTATKFTHADTNAIFRGSIGFDLYLSPSVALTMDAGFASVSGDFDIVKFGQIGGGLTFRF